MTTNFTGLLFGTLFSVMFTTRRNTRAVEQGQALLRENVHKTNPDLFLPYVSCIGNGTKIIVGGSGWRNFDAVVIDGPHAGCSGIISGRDFEIPR